MYIDERCEKEIGSSSSGRYSQQLRLQRKLGIFCNFHLAKIYLLFFLFIASYLHPKCLTYSVSSLVSMFWEEKALITFLSA